MKRKQFILTALIAATSLGITGCGNKGGDSKKAGTTIANVGSDTMLQLGMAWSEAYKKKVPDVNVEVNGGGSGVGIAGLINGSVDLANSSKAIEDKEKEDLKGCQGIHGGLRRAQHLRPQG